MTYFEDALANFVQDFAYGDAIRHLADKGFSAQQIKERYEYPLPIEKIDKIVQERLAKNSQSKNK